MSYQPNNPPVAPEDLANYVYEELSRLSAVMNAALARKVEFLHVAPARPREGDVYGADGTNWDPGSGQGIYAYYNSTWNKL